jgi:arsenate reductase (glutaredoxin)
MPAPLGSVPTRRMPRITVQGVEDQASTRNAIRFFRERRIVVTFRDVRRQPLTAAELRDLLDLLGVDALFVTAPEPGATGLVGRLLAQPALVRLPIVRFGRLATAGKAEDAWRAWLAVRPNGGHARG